MLATEEAKLEFESRPRHSISRYIEFVDAGVGRENVWDSEILAWAAANDIVILTQDLDLPLV